jgi:hypothetical protein
MPSHFSSLLKAPARRPFARPLRAPPLVRLGTCLHRCRLRLRTTPFLRSVSARPSPRQFLLRPCSSARPSASRTLARSLSRQSPSLRVGGRSLRALLAICQHRSRFQSPSWSIAHLSLHPSRSPRRRPAVLPLRALPRCRQARGPPLGSPLLLMSSPGLRCVSATATMSICCLSTTRHLLQLSRATSLCLPLYPRSPRPVARFSLSYSEERRHLPRRGLVKSRSDGL